MHKIYINKLKIRLSICMLFPCSIRSFLKQSGQHLTMVYLSPDQFLNYKWLHCSGNLKRFMDVRKAKKWQMIIINLTPVISHTTNFYLLSMASIIKYNPKRRPLNFKIQFKQRMRDTTIKVNCATNLARYGPVTSVTWRSEEPVAQKRGKQWNESRFRLQKVP